MKGKNNNRARAADVRTYLGNRPFAAAHCTGFVAVTSRRRWRPAL